MERKAGKTKLNCPICQIELDWIAGTSLSVDDGITVFCANKLCQSAEVFGHGTNIERAFEIIKQKYRL